MVIMNSMVYETNEYDLGIVIPKPWNWRAFDWRYMLNLGIDKPAVEGSALLA
jgi:hypothetical protein